MMNKFIYILMLAVFVSSCSDFLDEKNKSYPLANEYYKSADTYNALVNACYSSMRDVFGNRCEIFEAGTDLFVVGNRGLSSQGLGNYARLNPSDSEVEWFYKTVYQSIKTCNDGISYGEKFGHNASLIAQVRFLRAMYYFHLVQQFGGVALISENATSVVTKYYRTDAVDIYKFIVAEMNAALNDVPEASDANFGRVNKRVVNHFLAKVYLTRSYKSFAESTDVQNAIDFAAKAINGQALTLDYETEVFWPGKEKNAEVIFSVQYDKSSMPSSTSGGSMQSHYFGPYFGGSDANINDGNPYQNNTLVPSLQLHYWLADDPADKRYAATFMMEFYGSQAQTNKGTYYSYFKKTAAERANLEVQYYYPKPGSTQADVDAWKAVNPEKRDSARVLWATGDGVTYKGWELDNFDKYCPAIKKFSDPDAPFSTSGTSSRDIFLARVAESYLIRAEAYIKNGDAALAAADINVVRSRAGAYSITGSQATVDFILAERARELAGEYGRWYDLARTGKLVEYVSQYNSQVAEADMKGEDGSYKILRPIPAQALELNEAEFPQNPGY